MRLLESFNTDLLMACLTGLKQIHGVAPNVTKPKRGICINLIDNLTCVRSNAPVYVSIIVIEVFKRISLHWEHPLCIPGDPFFINRSTTDGGLWEGDQLAARLHFMKFAMRVIGKELAIRAVSRWYDNAPHKIERNIIEIEKINKRAKHWFLRFLLNRKYGICGNVGGANNIVHMLESISKTWVHPLQRPGSYFIGGHDAFWDAAKSGELWKGEQLQARLDFMDFAIPVLKGALEHLQREI